MLVLLVFLGDRGLELADLLGEEARFGARDRGVAAEVHLWLCGCFKRKLTI